MSEPLREHFDNLRRALLKLPATGTTGFEGLLAVTLTEITGVPFRLAGSGSQFGVDATATYEDDAVCFEGKRYDGMIPRDKVLTKIADLAINDDGGTDLWVLGATTQVSAQLVGDVRKLGAKHGITTLVLDWNDSTLPPLAVALAMAKSSAADFLEKNIQDGDLATKTAVALQTILEDGGFPNHAARLLAQLKEPSMGAALAREPNIHWLSSVFSSKCKARRSLCPGDNSAGSPAAREALLRRITPLLTDKPDNRIGVILGDEGNGKSWLAAQSWLSLPDKPLTVIFTADNFNEDSATDDITERLIDELIEQTDGRDCEAAHKRWRRKFERWRKGGTPDAPCLVVIIDGLNQRPKIDWARLIEAIGSELDRIGGRLLVTARTAYYASWIKPRLYSLSVEVPVPEWTDTERDAILAAHGIKGAGLRASVAQSLRNPRLLGIALELLQSAQLEELEELSVSRLLFEHMRVQERDAPSPRPAYEFARTLQDHAREILDRVTAQQRDDLNIFNSRLDAVYEGRFFLPVDGDPTRYSLGDDGLTLALGFALLDELRKACRNRRDLADVIMTMIEPINTLDRTAEVVFAALTIACLDDNYSVAIGAAIVGAFAELQNPNTDEFRAFAALTAKRPEVFMQAALRLCLGSVRQPNFDWIEAALHEVKEDDRTWSVMTPMIQSWLGCYSLAPEARMYTNPSRDPAGKVEEERTKRQSEIDTKISALSDSECGLLDMLVKEDNGDLAALTRLALTLIAGKPVAPFAEALVHWCFANALNAGHGAPYKEFTHLVCLNRADWRAAREAIQNACGMLESPGTSRTGRWVLKNLLQATGDPEDAARAQQLIEELTADWPKFDDSRLVEYYCSTDPCDPGSTKSENITRTAKDYAAINVSKIRLHMGNSDVDHFFAMACPGIARFEPQVGIDKHREFIINVLERSGLPLRQGMFEIHNHNALVTRAHAQQLVSQFTNGTAASGVESLNESDRWFVLQHHLLLAFPLLDANEQISAMLSEYGNKKFLLDLMNVAKPLDEEKLEALLDRAIRDGDERTQFILLAFARSTQTPLSPKTRNHLACLAQSPSEDIRAQALGLMAAIADEPSIEAVVKSNWNAARLERDGGPEKWYGSWVILEGAARGMISPDEALERIAPQLYGPAARRLGSDAARNIAQRIDISIKIAADLELDMAVPDIELSDENDAEPARYYVSEKPSDSSDLTEAPQQFSDSNKAFEERQQRAVAAFYTFEAKLKNDKASIILDRLRIPDFDMIAEDDKSLAESWFDLFINPPKTRCASIHNFGLLLAHALAGWNPEKSIRLFTALADSEPFVRITYGRAGITLDAMALWSAKDHPALKGLRFNRLDKTANNHEIAIEVLAALKNGKEDSLQEYIEAQLQSDLPAAIARALMVAGFSRQNEFNDKILGSYMNTPGFIGRAQAAAMYAYERNIWSEHWFGQMRKAREPEDFWRYGVLLKKVVDGRFDIWRSSDSESGEPFRMFWPSIEKQLSHRYKKWRRQREKKLFGDDAPQRIFLE